MTPVLLRAIRGQAAEEPAADLAAVLAETAALRAELASLRDYVGLGPAERA
jgi:hypothetical protein